jgi:hypothetical protein
MKPIKIAGITFGSITAGLAACLVITNPGPKDYEGYATTTLSAYLKEDVCSQVQSARDFRPILRNSCKILVDTSRPHIEQIIAINTTRQNFLLFSIYQTELSLPAPLAGYQFSTLGLFGHFFTYQAEEI